MRIISDSMQQRRVKARKKARTRSKQGTTVYLKPKAADRKKKIYRAIDRLHELKKSIDLAQQVVDDAVVQYEEAVSDFLERGEGAPLYGRLKREQGYVFPGDRWALEVFKETETLKITDPVRAYELLEEVQEGLGDQCMGFKIGDLRKYLTEEQIEECTNITWGNRRKPRLTKRVK